MKIRIKKGDTVIVNSGKDKGKQGKVDKVYPKSGKVIVSGINITKKHLKPSRKSPHGGIIDKLAPIDYSNVNIICPRCSKPSKISYKSTEGKKIRICRKCKESLD